MGLDDIDDSDEDILESGLSKDLIPTDDTKVSNVSPIRTHGGLLDVPSDNRKANDLDKFLVMPPKAGGSMVQECNSASKSTAANSESEPEDRDARKAAATGSAPKGVSVQTSSNREENESNDAQNELLMLAQKRRKQKEEEQAKAARAAEAEKNKELMKEGGLFKKGFLSNAAKKAKLQQSSGQLADDFLKKAEQRKAKNADIDLSTKKMSGTAGPDLTLPEVQNAMKTTLEDTDSWVTPELSKALASRPDLIMGMNNPRVQECLQMMRTDPLHAKEKFKDDKEVQDFLKEFSRLMGTHFDVLAKKVPEMAAKNKAAAAPAATSGVKTSPATGEAGAAVAKPKKKKSAIDQTAFAAAAANMNLSEEEKKKFQDPKVVQYMMNPKVQWVINTIRQGGNLDMRQIAKQDPQVYDQMKYLIEKGILGVQVG